MLMREAGVARPPLHLDLGHQRAERAQPGGESGGLRHDPAVGGHPVGDRGERARAGRLLVGDRVDDQIATQRYVQAAQHLRGEHHRRHAALHVAGAAAVEPAIAHPGVERVARPLLARLGPDHVDVAVEEHAAPAAGPRRAGYELGAATKVIPGWECVAVGGQSCGVGFPQLNLEPGTTQSFGEVSLQRRLIAWSQIGVRGPGVEAHERGQQVDELGLPAVDLIDHTPFELADHVSAAPGSVDG